MTPPAWLQSIQQVLEFTLDGDVGPGANGPVSCDMDQGAADGGEPRDCRVDGCV